MNQEQPRFHNYKEQQQEKGGILGTIGGIFGGGSGQTQNFTPPPPVPTANQSAAAALSQQALHADVDGQTYASTLLTGAASQVNSASVKKNTLLGG